MDASEGSSELLQLIDKIMGYADNQPLILNHLAVLRQGVVDLLAASEETAANYATLEAQVGRLYAKIEQLEFDVLSRDEVITNLRADAVKAPKPPALTFESIDVPPRSRIDGLL